jgi:hypothetical protein
LLRDDSEHEARERSTAELDAPSASQALGCCKHESSSRAADVALPLPGHNQPPHHARDTRAEVKARLGPRVAAHLPFANLKTQEAKPAASREPKLRSIRALPSSPLESSGSETPDRESGRPAVAIAASAFTQGPGR